MKNHSYFFTSESVSEGHPDKLCDRISDTILDAFLKQESEARVACETFATTNLVIIGGEVRLRDKTKLKATLDHVDTITRGAIRDIGYEQEKFHWQKVKIRNYLHEQSVDIAKGVDGTTDKQEGAGDQGIMFGYAVDETEDLMPAPLHYSHAILRQLATLRKSGAEPWLGPDAKSQLTFRYEKGVPVAINSIVVSTQHLDPKICSKDIRRMIEPYIREILPDNWIVDTARADATKWWINPTGQFVIGGPDGDTGLTGRKIIVDTYGGAAPHGGGAFSGKDPTKVDRSAAYVARYLAKNIVAGGFARRCTIQLSYAIGVAEPLSIYCDMHGTSELPHEKMERAISKSIDLTPQGIRSHLKLNRPIYARTSAYGHFGRAPEDDGGFSWEKTDLVENLAKEL